MTTLYVYALLGSHPRRAAGRGLAGERVRIVAVDGGRVRAAVGAMSAPPTPTVAALRAHDRVVRRLSALTRAVLPVRFGTVVTDTGDLARRLAARAADLAAALDLVAGREQMTLRVVATAHGGARRSPTPPRRSASGLGPGARYLAVRAERARRARSVPEIAWLRPALRRLVAAERAERHDTAAPLLASVHHLIPRGEAPAYLGAVARASSVERPVRVVASGPWPPYAFAPEALS